MEPVEPSGALMTEAARTYALAEQEGRPLPVRARVFSLKRVLIVSLTLSCLLPLLLIGSISYVSLRSLQENAVVSSLAAAARQNRSQLDTLVSVLDNVSQLAVMEFITAGSIERYAEARSYFDIFKASEGIKASFNMLSFANPDIGLIVLYDGSAHAIITQSAAAREPIDFDAMPRLLHRNTFTAFAPAPTLQKSGSDLVLGAARLIPNSVGRPIYLYFEVGAAPLRRILSRDQYGIAATHFIVDASGLIAWSDDPASFPPGSAYALKGGQGPWFRDRGFVVFPQQSDAGWSLMVSFPRSRFDAERTKWITGLLLASLISLSVSLLIAMLIWRILYVPLGFLRAEMDTVGGPGEGGPGAGAPEEGGAAKGGPESVTMPARAGARLKVREYTYLHEKVEEMRDRISALIEELKANERKKRHLEVEKLLFQINPHFLYNTLNNVQWLARINGQEEISALVSDLIKILHYNLRRTGEMTSVREEIDMLRRYVSIQQRRLDLRIELTVNVDPAAEEAPLPRFILQPLVENAIQHCHRDAVSISVDCRGSAGRGVRLDVCDNGAGMSAETMRLVLSQEWENGGGQANGLGIRYVKSLLDMVYAGRAVLGIQSDVGQGTRIGMELPGGAPG